MSCKSCRDDHTDDEPCPRRLAYGLVGEYQNIWTEADWEGFRRISMDGIGVVDLVTEAVKERLSCRQTT